jgi:hypothetical protein
MAVAALKQKFEPAVKTFHATVLVTRIEQWCVEAESAEDARELLALVKAIAVILAIACKWKWRALRGRFRR